jgi:putative aminopeptidase FrvX
VPQLPEIETVLATLRPIAEAPTAPYHEWHALEAIEDALHACKITAQRDGFGQLHARLARGRPARPLALVAHTDHPGFELFEASGTEGRARVLGGLALRPFSRPTAVLVHEDTDGAPVRATVDDFVSDADPPGNSPGHVRVRAEGPLSAGAWATLDLPGLEVEGDELRMRAADDLALCAVAVLTLAQLRADERPCEVHALFTRAEETGLFGARLAAEAGTLPRDACVVSLEASRALAHVPAGAGPVVRVGDLHNTFSNEAERYLRVARERLERSGIATQRALLTGGTCEASAFVRLGWSATGVALPNTNYHNATPDDRFAPEIVRLSDLRASVALLVEAAVAAGEDASEAWWPDVRRVPDRFRARLREGR